MPRIAQSPTCTCCGRTFNARLQRSSVSQLCEACFEEAGMENAHNDGHHQIAVAEDCHLCTATDPHAGFRTRTVTGNQGKVMTEADGRLQANAPALPEGAERVQLTGKRLGQPSTRYAGLQGSVIKRDTHTYGGHSNWVLVLVDGIAQRRWFWAEDVEALAPARRSRSRRAAA